MVAYRDVDMDEWRLRRTDAVFEGVLHQWDKYHRCHLNIAVLYIGVESDFYRLW